MKRSTKKGLAWIGVILGALFLAAGGVALWRAGQAKDVLDQITEPASSQREVGVYVLEEDPAQDLAQTAGYRYGGLEEEAFPALEQALGEPPDWQRYPTAFALADALEKGERQAVVLEEAYQKSLSDARGYEWALTGMRLVGTVPVEKAPAPSLPAPEGTPAVFAVPQRQRHLWGCFHPGPQRCEHLGGGEHPDQGAAAGGHAPGLLPVLPPDGRGHGQADPRRGLRH